MINNILSDPNDFCITYGCGALSIGRTWGVKTGTSEPYEDSSAIGETWTYGYTPDLVTGVWAGNSDNSPMFNITSTSISYRAVRDFMIEALVDTPASNFPNARRAGRRRHLRAFRPQGDARLCGAGCKNLLPAAKAPKQDDDWWQPGEGGHPRWPARDRTDAVAVRAAAQRPRDPGRAVGFRADAGAGVGARPRRRRRADREEHGQGAGRASTRRRTAPR